LCQFLLSQSVSGLPNGRSFCSNNPNVDKFIMIISTKEDGHALKKAIKKPIQSKMPSCEQILRMLERLNAKIILYWDLAFILSLVNFFSFLNQTLN